MEKWEWKEKYLESTLFLSSLFIHTNTHQLLLELLLSITDAYQFNTFASTSQPRRYVEQGKRGKSYADQMALLAESREVGRQRTKDNAEGAGVSHTQG